MAKPNEYQCGIAFFFECSETNVSKKLLLFEVVSGLQKFNFIHRLGTKRAMVTTAKHVTISFS